MDARLDAYFTNLLQDGVILEDHSEREHQDEFGFIYANPHAQVFTQASQTPTQKGSTPERAQRGGKFTIEEDKLLVSAYLNHMPLAQCNENSLMNRWLTIQLAVNKLCGCFAGIEAKHQSGMNEEDKLVDLGECDATFVDLERPIGEWCVSLSSMESTLLGSSSSSSLSEIDLYGPQIFNLEEAMGSRNFIILRGDFATLLLR
ncbi:hypothetical protein C3L33_13079, partial [Rhododendron williamsianum]